MDKVLEAMENVVTYSSQTPTNFETGLENIILDLENDHYFKALEHANNGQKKSTLGPNC